nr:hypothetical protein CFP56_76731 [Quercus suber]
MDDLTKRWKELSLSEVEGNKVDILKKSKIGEHVVVAKFLTCRNINVEAVARTFRPFWRIRANFELCQDDKDCVMWLQSKGTLVAEERQFRPWIRVVQYNSSRKTVVEAQGYDESRNKNHASTGVVMPISDDPNEINGEMTMLMDVPVIVADVTQVERNLVIDKSESLIQSESLSDGGFQIGWIDRDRDKKGRKSGSNKKGDRARGRNKQLLAEVVPFLDSLLKQNGLTKSTWTRIAQKPNQSKNHVLEVMGPKRRNDY